MKCYDCSDCSEMDFRHQYWVNSTNSDSFETGAKADNFERGAKADKEKHKYYSCKKQWPNVII